jgi:hypothetical protein
VLQVLQVLQQPGFIGRTPPQSLQHLGVAPVLRGVADLATGHSRSVSCPSSRVPARCNTVQHRVLRPVLQPSRPGFPGEKLRCNTCNTRNTENAQDLHC